jgi:hypothetical protein
VIFALKVLISACVISFASWLAGRSPAMAGFIVALPLATMMVLPFAQFEHGDAHNSFLLAKSVLLAVPLSLFFFVPFLFAERLRLGFWQTYALGCVFLLVGFGLHRIVTKLWLGGEV